MGRTIIGSIGAILASLTAMPVLAAADYFLEIKGTKGETRSTIEIQSFSWGVSNSGAAMTRRETAPEHHGMLQVTTAREAGSGLATGRVACTAGARYAQATLRGPTGAWELHGVVVAGCPNGGMTLNYEHARATKSRSNIQNN
jgi:hypothetical protein